MVDFSFSTFVFDMNFESHATEIFSVNRIPFSQSGILPSITLDYLRASEALKPYYNRHFSDEEFYGQILEKKLEFTAERRSLLVKALKRQYENADIPINSSPELKSQLDALSKEHTFVITTGHQMCLHTGPLYFVYKIISAIAMSRRLTALYPEYTFVPVYWMASEDHDFEEINHFHHHQVRFQWNYRHHDLPVGRLPLDGYSDVLDAYSKFLKPHSLQTKEWLDIMADSYLKAHSLSQATRRLVHNLLGRYGVVIVDGDDVELKRSFRLIVKNEILHRISSEIVRSTTDQIGKLWFAQVNSRDINFFYLSPSGRVRIARDRDGRFTAGAFHWTEEELESEIELYPERFSPDVITRPLYQEFVLPNLAYVGGANELAYWFQLKGLFSVHQIPMPILLLRNSFVMLHRKTYNFLEKYGIPKEYIFSPPSDTLKKLVRKKSPTDAQYDYFVQRINEVYHLIRQYNSSVDQTLIGSTEALRVRHIKALEKLRHKVLRSEMRKNEWLRQKLSQLHQTVYPNEVLQERYENAGQYYCRFGKSWIDELIRLAEMPSLDVYAVFLGD